MEKNQDNKSGLDGDRAALHNQFLSCLGKMCELYKLPFSQKQAVHGIPLEGGILSLRQLPRAALNLNIKSEFRRENPGGVSGLLFPFMVFFKNGDMGVALEKEASGKSVKFWVCARNGAQSARNLDLAECHNECHDSVLLTTASQSALDNSSDVGIENSDETGWFWPIVWRFWPNWSYVIIATLLINLLGLALPLFVMNVYDKVIPNESIPTLWALVGGVGIALFFDFLLRLLRANMVDNSGERVDLAVSANLFQRAMDVRMADRHFNAGQISNRVREFDSVRDFFSSSMITTLIDVVFIIIFLLFLWFLVGNLAIIPLIAVPVVLLFTFFVQIPLKQSVERNQAASTNRHSVLVDAMVGIETVKTISAEGILQGRWEKAVANSASSAAALRFWSSLAVYFTMLAQQFVSVVVITWGVFLVIDGSITVGALIASNILVGRILSPLGSTASTLVRLQQSVSAFKNISSMMRLARDSKQTSGVFKGISRGDIEFKDVSFAYPGQISPALNGFSVKIKQGETVAILGRVGSGKSTIGKLLCGLYTQNTGEILVDGTDVRKYSLADLRGEVGYLSQETELFSGSLRENVLLARPERSENLERILDLSGINSFIGQHPSGLDMDVGERGKALSGGQRQAVGIARLILADPKILYLDEPTSQMDLQTETQLISRLGSWLTKDKTVVIATHRHSLLSLVDRVLIVEAGRVIADGPKAQVLKMLTKAEPRKRLNVKSGSNAKK